MVYGKTTSPLTEYFIIDNFGTLNPAAHAIRKGTFFTDGGYYDFYEYRRVSPGLGDPVLPQYFSVRRNKRVGGTVSTKNHFDAWRSVGLVLGRLEEQIVAVEGWYSGGSASIAVSR